MWIMDSLSILFFGSVISFAIGLIPVCRNFAEEIIVDSWVVILGISFGVAYSILDFYPNLLIAIFLLLLLLVGADAIAALVMAFFTVVFIRVLQWSGEVPIIIFWVFQFGFFFFLPGLPGAIKKGYIIWERNNEKTLVDKRITQAVNRRIFEKAQQVAKTLGNKQNVYEDSRIKIIGEIRGQTEILYNTENEYKTVFLGGPSQKKGGYFFYDGSYEKEVNSDGTERMVQRDM